MTMKIGKMTFKQKVASPAPKPKKYPTNKQFAKK